MDFFPLDDSHIGYKAYHIEAEAKVHKQPFSNAFFFNENVWI